MNQKRFSFRVSGAFLVLLCVSFLLRILIGTFYDNPFDLKGYNIPWALTIRDGLFQVYQNAEEANYPPLFFIFLAPLSGLISHATQTGFWQMQMLLIKLVPVLFDMVLVLAACRAAKKFIPDEVWLAALCWGLNTATIFNCAFWGQTDSMMLVFIMLMFLYLQEKKPVWACVFFALGCTAKLQMAYFAPVLFLHLCYEYRSVKTAAKAIGAGLAVGIAVWLPFMIGSGDPALPFRIYFGGYDRYNYINLCAYNIYGVFGNDWVTDQKSVLGGSFSPEEGFRTGGFTYANLNAVVTLLIVCCLIGIYVYAWRKKKVIPAAFPALFFMNSIFILTTKMHERYQMPVLALLFLCYLFSRHKVFLYVFIIQSVLVCCNQAALLFSINHGGGFRVFYENSQSLFSFVNVVLYGYLNYSCFRIFLSPAKGDFS